MAESEWEDVTDEWEDVTTTPAKKPWGEVGKEAVSNIPSSAVEFGKALFSPVAHPVETAKAIGKLVLEGLFPGGKQEVTEAMAKSLLDRYGSVEKLKATISKDPVGVTADIATLFTTSGGAAKAAGLSKIGSALSKTGAVIDPVNMAVAPVTAAVKGVAKVPGLSPERLYASSVKPNIKKGRGLEKLDVEIKAGLEEGILPTRKGLDKLDETWKAMQNQVDDAISGSRTTIPKKEIFGYIDELYKKADDFDYGIYPSESQDVIKKATEKFLKEYAGDTLSAEVAQKMKKGLHKNIKEQRFGSQFGQRPQIDVDIDYKIAQGLREAIYKSLEKTHPELRSLGKKEGALIGLREAIEKGAQRIAKRDIIGIGAPIKTGVGGALAGNVGALVGAIAGVVDAPVTKARLAIALNKAKQIKMINERLSLKSKSARLVGEIYETEKEQ